MKKLFVISVCIFFMLSLIAFAQNETNVTLPPAGNITLPPSGNTTNAGNMSNATLPSSGNATQVTHPAAPPSAPPATSRNASQPKAAATENCNRNGKADAGETCFSCPQDVKCQSGQICNLETGTCDTHTNYTPYIVGGIGIFVLLGLFFFAKRLMKKKEEPMQLPRQMPQQAPAALQGQNPLGQTQQPPFGQQQQPLTTNQQPMANNQQSPVANVQIQLPPQEPERTAEQKETDKEQGFQEMSEVVNEHPGETMPQKFIRQMREKGWNDERIRMKMKESNWSETQIALEFLKAPKFIKKQ